jgi:hypothetical protein
MVFILNLGGIEMELIEQNLFYIASVILLLCLVVLYKKRWRQFETQESFPKHLGTKPNTLS